ncbi:hypothetical protein MPER_00986 [Moniliophthora perniciosa FA553]|nr:hypothetical protein MPER_00986 [Moniliophthora perniciosa FA553]
MLHFAHPQALRNVLDAVTNVKKFREFLGALTARSENSQIAKDVLIDQVDYSGIDLAGLIPILNELHDSVQTVEGVVSLVSTLRSLTNEKPLKLDNGSPYANL